MPTYKFTHPKAAAAQEATINQLLREKQRVLTSLRSRTKGELGELMTTLFFDEAKRSEIITDRKTFKTPYGGRRVDNFHPTTLQAVESKNTRVTARRFVRVQIKKDAYLLQQKMISSCTWVCFEGASKRAIELIQAAGIEFVDMGGQEWRRVVEDYNDDDIEIIEV